MSCQGRWREEKFGHSPCACTELFQFHSTMWPTDSSTEYLLVWFPRQFGSSCTQAVLPDSQETSKTNLKAKTLCFLWDGRKVNLPELCLAMYQLTQRVTLLSASINLVTDATNVALLCFYLHQKKMNAAYLFAFSVMPQAIWMKIETQVF